MSFAAAAGRLAESLFTTGGSDARWFSGGSGGGVTCKVLHGQQDQVERFGEEQAQLPAGMLRVRKSDVAEPADGDTVTIYDDAGAAIESRKIIGTPKLDKFGNVWTCEAPPA